MADLSLRPLATAIGSSPRVLLFLFGSKPGLSGAARARARELALLSRVRSGGGQSIAALAANLWLWLSAVEHRALLTLWVEGYARSLAPDGPWADFARATVDDWLDLLAGTQLPSAGNTPAGETERTLILAVLRGALLDLLATGDISRTTEAVRE